MAKKANQTEVKALIDTFTEMPIDQQTTVLDQLTEIHGTAKSARANELLAELRLLGVSTPKIGKPGSNRASPKALYRGPQGQEWSGRGGLPRWARELGITDKAGLEQYRIQS